jgi:N-acyl-D-aspartate/D-glutamate deacylase
MAELARQAVAAGALGFSTSRTLNHRTSDGQPTPTLTAGEDELTGIAQGLAAAGRGVLQVVSDFAKPELEFAMLRRIVERSGRPLSFSLVQNMRAPDQWQQLLALLGAANADGLPMKAQVCGRPVGILFGFELTLNWLRSGMTLCASTTIPPKLKRYAPGGRPSLSRTWRRWCSATRSAACCRSAAYSRRASLTVK